MLNRSGKGEGNLVHLRLAPLLQHLPQSHNTILPACGQVAPRLIEISSPDHAVVRLHFLLECGPQLSETGTGTGSDPTKLTAS